MVQSSTEHTEVIVKTALPFLRRELSIFSEFVGKGGGIAGRRSRFCGFVTVVLIVGGFFGIGIVVSGSRVSVVGFVIVVRFVVVGLILVGAGLFAESFPVSGIDCVSESLHSFKSGRFALLAHDVFDTFR